MNQMVTPLVARYMQHRAGEYVVAADAAAAMNFKTAQVSSSLARLARDPDSGISRVPFGVGVYTYNPPTKATLTAVSQSGPDVGNIIEIIATISEGRWLGRGTDNSLYSLRFLETQ